MTDISLKLPIVGFVGFMLCAVVSANITATPGQISRPKPTQAVDPAAVTRSEASHRAVVDKYCLSCHNRRQNTAGLMLDAMDLNQVPAHADVWEKVVRKLRVGLMPPAGMPRPDEASTRNLVSWLESQIDQAAKSAPEPGHPTIRRLNRTEYANAIRDLLAVDVDARAYLPADDSGFGFDNIGDVLTVSPGLVDRYISAARRIAQLAVGAARPQPAVQSYRVSRLLLQDDRISEDLPFGTRGGLLVRHQFPADGEYLIKIVLQRAQSMTSLIRGRSEANVIDVRVDGARLKLFAVGSQERETSVENSDQAEDPPLEVRTAVKAGARMIGVAIAKRPSVAREGLGPIRLPVASSGFQGADTTDDVNVIELAIDSVEIHGPFNGHPAPESPGQRRIFVCRPLRASDEEPCARRILAGLARRAYRRPVTKDDVDLLLDFYRTGRKSGEFDTGIQSALERLLVAPEFLFRAEHEPPGAIPGSVSRVSDVELASRLSFFLWSSIPDDELLSVAERGGLHDRTTLEQQVHRMLRDPRSASLITNFFGQWLLLRNISVVQPDVTVFPGFDDGLREAMRSETELFLSAQLRQDRPVLEMLSANYTYVNERLARHYGIRGIYGSHFRKVTLPDDRRVGLLGQASILTVTSYANRTSPVLRGKWLLETLLGAPPPNPPPDVPPFPEADSKVRSVRERLEQHRRSPTCAGCHASMDPLGFAFENFDAIGAWRETDAGVAVDVSGRLPTGEEFHSPSEFRQALMKHQDNVVETVATKLLTYALGRGVEYFDMPAVREIVRDTGTNGGRWSALVTSIVTSVPFQMRKAS